MDISDEQKEITSHENLLQWHLRQVPHGLLCEWKQYEADKNPDMGMTADHERVKER
jgi:hypothetical protein